MAILYLYFNQAFVGEFIRQANGAHVLHYSPGWLNNSKGRPVSLSLPLQKSKITSSAVYNYFDNLLPDSKIIRDRIVNRFQAQSSQPFDLLAKIGRDSIGALTILTTPGLPVEPALKARKLNNEALKKLLQSYQSDIPLGMHQDFDDFRISVAGAQEKTALLKMYGAWHVPTGMTATTHIIKLPIGEIRGPDAILDLSTSVENEWLCMELARELGFDVPASEIIEVDGQKALAVERFDRKWNKAGDNIIRLPQEDMCQAHSIAPSIKYEAEGGPGIAKIMKLLMGSSNAMADREAFMGFQVFQWLIGATDGHAKNFSISLKPGGSYRLTPFYDIISAFPLLSGAGVAGGTGLNKRDLTLAMSLNASKGKKRKLELIFPRHFLATAKAVGFDTNRMQQIMKVIKILMHPQRNI